MSKKPNYQYRKVRHKADIAPTSLDGGDISDSEINDNPQKVELLDYDDTIKKETIPVHANPFMSYLHMHLNRSLDKGKTDTKYFNGASIAIPNSVSPTDSTSLSPLIAPIEGKTKSHKKRASSNHHSTNTANNFTNNNNNNSHTKLSSRNSRFDLALNLSQRLFFHVSLTLCKTYYPFAHVLFCFDFVQTLLLVAFIPTT